jgi:type II secretory pathway pseudopilin PulG
MAMSGTQGSSRSRANLRCRLPGFTLVEAMVSLSITAVAGSALLLGVASSMDTAHVIVEETIAAGLAQQLMDEVAGSRYAEAGSGGYQPTLGTEAGEAGSNRERFDDLDDFNNAGFQPPCDYWGVTLGADDGEGGQRHPNFQVPPGYFDRWLEAAEVYYVSNADMTTRLPAGQTSDYRAVHVRVYLNDPEKGPRLRAELRRVFAYVPAQ